MPQKPLQAAFGNSFVVISWTVTLSGDLGKCTNGGKISADMIKAWSWLKDADIEFVHSSSMWHSMKRTLSSFPSPKAMHPHMTLCFDWFSDQCGENGPGTHELFYDFQVWCCWVMSLCFSVVERSRVSLTASETNATGYINASYVMVRRLQSLIFVSILLKGPSNTWAKPSLVFPQGRHHSKEFIVSQTPLCSTVEDFWRMIWEHDTHTVVRLPDTHCQV